MIEIHNKNLGLFINCQHGQMWTWKSAILRIFEKQVKSESLFSLIYNNDNCGCNIDMAWYVINYRGKNLIAVFVILLEWKGHWVGLIIIQFEFFPILGSSERKTTSYTFDLITF